MMRILFQSRPNLLTEIGGDSTQVLKTKEAIEKMGHTVDIDLSENADVSKYDIVHIFNLQTFDGTKAQIYNARNQGKPVVLSTIWWDFQYMDLDDDYRNFRGWKYHLCLSLLTSLFWVNKYKRIYFFDKLLFHLRKRKNGRIILNSVDWILPNSVAELEILAQDFSMPELRKKSSIVVNAIDSTENTEALPPGCQEELDRLPDDYVLCVGRIEPTKGQAKIIRAMMVEKEIPLAFIGRGIEKPYGQWCRKLADKRGNVFFVPQVDHDYLGAFYQKAKVHALPSLRESPGLVSLEAALYDTNIVTSFQAPTWEYFGMDAFICNPEDLSSIHDVILEAYHSEIHKNLKKRIITDFNWMRTAEQTVMAYKKILKVVKHTKTGSNVDEEGPRNVRKNGGGRTYNRLRAA